jgi:hypothetical protein
VSLRGAAVRHVRLDCEVRVVGSGDEGRVIEKGRTMRSSDAPNMRERKTVEGPWFI